MAPASDPNEPMDPIEPQEPQKPEIPADSGEPKAQPKEAAKLDAYVSSLKKKMQPPMWVWGTAVGLATALVALIAAPTYLLRNKDVKFKETSNKLASLQGEYNTLKKKYDELDADRNNILTQTKRLMADQSKLNELQEQYDELSKANELIMRQKAQLHQESLRTKKDLNTMESLFGRLKDSFQQLTIQKDALDRDNDSLRKQLAAKIQAAPEYQALDKQAKSLQNANQNQANQIKDLTAKLKTATDRIGKIQGRDRQFAKQIQGYQKAAEKMKADNTKLTKTNQDLNKILTSMPSNIKDIASQNKKLTRETAEMHYNMGVFFTENRKYELAVREFTRTLQIEPNHAKAHYNLGYLFAERYERHDEAIAHFRSYLQMNPTGREAELVRSYLLQREVFDDKPKEGIIKGKGIA